MCFDRSPTSSMQPAQGGNGGSPVNGGSPINGVMAEGSVVRPSASCGSKGPLSSLATEQRLTASTAVANRATNKRSLSPMKTHTATGQVSFAGSARFPQGNSRPQLPASFALPGSGQLPGSPRKLQPRVVPIERSPVKPGSSPSLPPSQSEACARPSLEGPCWPSMMSRVQTAGQEQQPPLVPRSAALMETIEPQQVFPSEGSQGSLVQQLSPKQDPTQHRLLEELHGINKMLETMSTASTRTDERCAACEVSTLELQSSTLELKAFFQDVRRDIDGLQSRFLDLSDLIVARETMAADIEHLRGLQQELRMQLNEETQQLQPLQSQVQAQYAEHRHEASLMSAQQQLQGEQLQALQTQLLQQLQAQGEKQQEAEHVPQASELVQYIANVKELQNAELDVLRQELQHAMKTSSQHTEGMAELHKKCEDLASAAELLAKRLPNATSQPSMSAAAPHREEAVAFAVSDARLELHARLLTSTFEELRAEMRRLAELVARHGMDLEAERATRALDIEGERAACAGVASDVAEMRLNISQLSERLTAVCRQALGSADTKGSGFNEEKIRAEVAHSMSLHRKALDARLSELAAQLEASTKASTQACSKDMRGSADHGFAQHRAEVQQKLDAFADEITASADATISAAKGCAIHHSESIDRRLSVYVSKDDLQAEVKANLTRHQEQASALTFAVDVENKLFSELAIEREARIQEHAELAACLEQTNICMEESHSRITQRVGDLGHLLQATDNCLTNAVRKEIDSLHEGMNVLATQVYADKAAPELLSGTKRSGALLQQEMSDVASLADQMWRGVETY